MRTLTAGQTTLFQAADRAHHVKVEVENGSGTMIDLTTKLVNWRYGQVVDDHHDSGSFSFSLGKDTDSLAPGMQTSTWNTLDDGTTYSALLELNRELKFYAAVTALGTDPVAGDWELVYHARIQDVDDKANPIVVSTWDAIASTLDGATLQTEATYGSDSGTVTLENVIQQNFTDADTGVTLYTPTASGAGVTPYKRGLQSALAVSKQLSESIGWTARSRWRESTSAFAWTLYEPDRNASVAVWTFGPDRYIATPNSSRALRDIRNKVRVRYTNAETGKRESVTVTDSASVTKYGGPRAIPRFMEISEAEDSVINTEAKATSLANAVLNDLAEPFFDYAIELPFFWPAELGDLYAYSANGKTFTATQNLAAVSIQHSGDGAGKAKTTILARGKPAGARKSHLARDVKVTGPGVPEEATNALSNVKLTRDVANGQWTLTWTRGGLVERVLVWVNELLETSTDDPHAITGDPVANKETGAVDADTYTGSIPSRGRYTGVVLIPYDEAGKAGPVWKGLVSPYAGIPPKNDFLYHVPAVGTADLYGRTTDEQGKAGTVYVWVNPDGYENPDYSAAADGQVTYNGGSAFSFGPDTVFTNAAGTSVGTILNNIPAGAETPKVVAVEIVSEDGRTTGQIPYRLSSVLDLVDNLSVIKRNKITKGWQFGGTIGEAPYIADDEAAVLALDPAVIETTRAIAADTGQQYEHNGTEWVTTTFSSTGRVGFLPALVTGVIKTIHLTALSVTTDILAALAVTTEKIAAGAVTAVKIAVGTLSEIATDAGIIIEGMLRNSGGTALLNLDAVAGAAGDDGINLKVPGLVSYANGTLVLTNPLSQAQDDLGTMVAGLIQNDPTTPTAGIRVDAASTRPAGWTTYLDLAASGSGAVLAHNELSLNADGTANWSTAVLNPPTLTDASLTRGHWTTDGDGLGTDGTEYRVSWDTRDLIGGETVTIVFYRAGSSVDSVTSIDASLGTYPTAPDDYFVAGGSSTDLVGAQVTLYTSGGTKLDTINTRDLIQST